MVSFLLVQNFQSKSLMYRYVNLQFMWLNLSSDDDARWLPPRLLNVNHCQSPYQTYKHHHQVSHTKRPTTTPITIKLHQMSSNTFRELALSTDCRFPGIYRFKLHSFRIYIVRYEIEQGLHFNITCYTRLTYTSYAANSSAIIRL